jgi:hypothetical protein
LRFPDYLSPSETAGFSHTDRHRFEWDEATRNPWIRFRYGVNRTSVGDYEFVDDRFGVFPLALGHVDERRSSIHQLLEDVEDVGVLRILR